MSRVVALNGPAGVGKTTVGRRLAQRARNGVCIHGDDLRRFVVAREDGTVPQGLSYVGGAALTDVYLAAGYEIVVFEYVFTNASHVARFTEALRADVPVELITLWAPLEVVVERQRGRGGRLEDRVVQCWGELAANLGELGTIVDASGPVDAVVSASLGR